MSIVELPVNKFISSLIMLLALGYLPGIAQAEPQSLTSIVFQAESFLANYPYSSPYPAQFELAQLDKRLKLKPCAKALDIKFTRSEKVMGNTSLTVRCPSPVNWQLHLPVKVVIFDDVVVNKTPLVKGQTIDTESIIYSKRDISRLHQGFFRRTDPLENLQAKRNLAAKSILNASNLSPLQLVKSGQRVTILLNINGLQVKTSGLALQSASKGQVIKVRNTQSNKVVEGVVSAPGQITVRL